MVLGHLRSDGDINEESWQPGMPKAHKSMRLVATGWNSGAIASRQTVAPRVFNCLRKLRHHGVVHDHLEAAS